MARKYTDTAVVGRISVHDGRIFHVFCDAWECRKSLPRFATVEEAEEVAARHRNGQHTN